MPNAKRLKQSPSLSFGQTTNHNHLDDSEGVSDAINFYDVRVVCWSRGAGGVAGVGAGQRRPLSVVAASQHHGVRSAGDHLSRLLKEKRQRICGVEKVRSEPSSTQRLTQASFHPTA